MNQSSGPFVTQDDTPVTIFGATIAYTISRVRILNEGSVGGFYSYDGGTVWHRIPALSVVEDNDLQLHNVAIQVKRQLGAANLTGVFCSIGY